MRRRDFIAGLGGAAVLPVTAWAQKAAVPIIGYLTGRSSDIEGRFLTAFRQGLKETGYVEGQNVAIEYRFAEGKRERVPLLAADLLLRQVALIVYAGVPNDDELLPLMRNSRIPVIFVLGTDPVEQGLVTSLSHPGGNLTGVSNLVNDIVGKHIGLLHELLPNAKKIAVLRGTERQLRNIHAVASSHGLEVLAIEASGEGEIDAAFARLKREGADALFVPLNPVLISRAKQIVELAARHRMPTIYARRNYVEAGGLMSYDYDSGEGYRRIGIYAGRILKGEKPADLPVFQPTRFEFVINLTAAKAIGLEVPTGLLAIADELIE